MQRGPKTCTVLIAADIRILRDSLQQAISDRQGFRVVGAAGSAHGVLRLVRAFLPDIVLTDFKLARESAFGKSVTGISSATKIVAFAVSESEEEILCCAAAGVAGYVRRDASLDEMMRTLDAATRGELICPPRIAASAFRLIATLAADKHPLKESCTLRESEVLALIAEGLSNKEIARRLGIAVSTVKNHVHVVLAKMSVRCRSQAIMRFHSMQPGERPSNSVLDSA